MTALIGAKAKPAIEAIAAAPNTASDGSSGALAQARQGWSRRSQPLLSPKAPPFPATVRRRCGQIHPALAA